MKLINADDLKDWSEIVPLTDDGGIDINDFEEKLKSMPTVDAVPVIRCKDCKFSMSGIDKYNERYILCQLHERSYGVIDDGFCNWAERKEE